MIIAMVRRVGFMAVLLEAAPQFAKLRSSSFAHCYRRVAQRVIIHTLARLQFNLELRCFGFAPQLGALGLIPSRRRWRFSRFTFSWARDDPVTPRRKMA